MILHSNTKPGKIKVEGLNILHLRAKKFYLTFMFSSSCHFDFFFFHWGGGGWEWGGGGVNFFFFLVFGVRLL